MKDLCNQHSFTSGYRTIELDPNQALSTTSGMEHQCVDNSIRARPPYVPPLVPLQPRSSGPRRSAREYPACYWREDGRRQKRRRRRNCSGPGVWSEARTCPLHSRGKKGARRNKTQRRTGTVGR